MPLRFSIATPCFDSRAVLPRCIGSIRGQTGIALEHLVQDGAAPDGTADWLKTQTGIAWRSERDNGMYDAINRAWSRARGEVLSWLNADEQYLPGALALVDKTFRAHPEADVVWGDTIIVGPDGNPLSARREISLRAAYVRNGFLYALSCSTFFHRRLFDEGLLKFDTTFRLAGDADLILRLLAARRRFVHIRSYIGLFGTDGRNLSVKHKKRMGDEGTLLRARHPIPWAELLGRAVLLGRFVERYCAGCYHTADLAYDFALDEIPSYRHVEALNVTARFSYETAVKR